MSDEKSFPVAGCLVIIGLCVACAFGYSLLPKERISMSNALAIEVGMNKEEVQLIAGPPHIPSKDFWRYRVSGASDLLNIDFDVDGNVARVSF